jgi:predicted regulator of Ras-like GTPase activity (Roadblock/LC7/MglB family)
VDAKQALGDLMEISSQVDAAVLVGAGGAVEASAGTSDEGAGLARAARELLEAAGRVRSAAGDQPVTQLEAATRAGSVFIVRDGDRVIAAATGPSPTVGLVFYDLKTCLRALTPAEGEDRPAASSARGTRPGEGPAGDEEDDGAA